MNDKSDHDVINVNNHNTKQTKDKDVKMNHLTNQIIRTQIKNRLTYSEQFQ